LHHHEKTAFLKFFVTYFVSVALLILVAGEFYFTQTNNHYLKTEEFSLIEYARHIKMGDGIQKYQESEYQHTFTEVEKHIDIRNFTITQTTFSKMIPMNRSFYYLKVIKSKKSFDTKVSNLKIKIIIIQILLLLLFAYISYRLAKSALKPLQESIATLDKFAKDLIHDLNTPVTSIKLNLKLLQKVPELHDNSAILRLKKSVHDISELHDSLTTLLQEETFQMQILNLCEIVEDVVQTQKQIHQEITFKVECSAMRIKLNKNATKQILQNIISNACKYNKKDGYVKIYTKENALYIEDSGHGIKEPSKIFNRAYSDEHSSGIGLDIVKRLAHAMNIKIKVESSLEGTTFIIMQLENRISK